MTTAEMNEIRKCKRDFLYFCEKYLKIVDKKGKASLLKLNRAQKRILSATDDNHFIKILKARQLGSSTFIAAFYFWKTLFTVNERTIIIAHNHEAVKNIFRIYKFFYESLPKFMQFKTVQSSANSIEFDTGSYIKVGSASSESFRGISAISNLHLSEVAFWSDMKTAISTLFQVVGENPFIILETTANSINEFHTFWEDNNGYTPLFLSWDSDDNNKLSALSATSKKLLKEKPEILDHLGEHEDNQIKWAVETFFIKCAGDISRFKQEYAIDPISCFISSGDKYFDITFPNVKEIFYGYSELEPPKPGRIYSIGVDSSGGSINGDLSSFVVSDITNKQKPRQVATFYDRMPLLKYAARVHQECLKYNAFAVVEKNSYGLAVIEHLLSKEYSFMYTKTNFDVATDRYTEVFGFWTGPNTRPILLSRFQEYVNLGKIEINDPRLQAEINAFVYISGKPQAASGKHDDMIIAAALSLQALEQYEYIASYVSKPTPTTAAEWVKLEISLGMPKEELIRQGVVKNDKKKVSDSYMPW